jgi:hypothetical protein
VPVSPGAVTGMLRRVAGDQTNLAAARYEYHSALLIGERKRSSRVARQPTSPGVACGRPAQLLSRLPCTARILD